MKKGTVIGILLSVISLLVMFALALYLTLSNLDMLFLNGPTAAETNADTAIAALYETEPAVTAEVSSVASEGSTSDISGSRLIWAGDSRTLGMQDTMENEDIYIGAAGEGYYWLAETGLPIIKEAIASNPASPVVFNFGVNDYDNLSNYLSLYEEIVSSYPDTHFYFLAVNPIDSALCDNITNEEIMDFNNQLKAAYPDAFLDSFTYIMVNEIVTTDGIHYSEEDYQLIYEFAANQIAKKEQAG